MTHAGGRPRKWTSVAEMQKAIDAYFAACDAHMSPFVTKIGTVVDVSDPTPYTMTGLAETIGISRKRLKDYEGRDDDYGEEFRPTIARAREMVERDSEERLQRGKGSDRGIMFSLKNNYGWRDTQEIEHRGGIGIEISDRGRSLIDRLTQRLRGGGASGASERESE